MTIQLQKYSELMVDKPGNDLKEDGASKMMR